MVHFYNIENRKVIFENATICSYVAGLMRKFTAGRDSRVSMLLLLDFPIIFLVIQKMIARSCFK